MIEPNTVLASRYRVERKLGQGGMGAVYLAVDEKFSNPVALKQTLVPVEREDLRRAFRREAALLNRLKHASLPKVIDFFEHGVSEILVMEYIAGEDLGELLRRNRGPFSTPRVLEWADRLLDALVFLHTRQPPVIHRDIKPQNMKLTPEGDVILLDFGLAKGAAGLQSTVTTSSVVAGTPCFAPLEQTNGEGTDARSDLYSLAATLYTLVTYRLPIDAGVRASALVNGKPDPLPPVHVINTAVPEPVSRVIHEAMSLRRASRPESASEMRRALREAATATMPGTVRFAAATTAQASDANVARSDTVPVMAPAPSAAPASLRSTEREPWPPRATVAGAPGVTAPDAAPPGGGRRTALEIGAVIVAVGVLALGAVFIILFPRVLDRRSPAAPPAPNGQAAPARQAPAGGDTAVDVSGARIELAYVPAGSFDMGSTDGKADEEPTHRVTISKPFLMGKYEVTQAQWNAVMGSNPATFTGNDERPVEQVSWEDCHEFIRRLNERSGGGWRLPTEAEWEYACRAGSTGDYAGSLDAMAWYGDNSGSTRIDADRIWRTDQNNYLKRLAANGCQTHPVGRKRPNAWGLYDMHGNVWEWCQDRYDQGYYATSPGTDPAGASSGSDRVLRGGGWGGGGANCRSAVRAAGAPSYRSVNVGLRLVRTSE